MFMSSVNLGMFYTASSLQSSVIKISKQKLIDEPSRKKFLARNNPKNPNDIFSVSGFNFALGFCIFHFLKCSVKSVHLFQEEILL